MGYVTRSADFPPNTAQATWGALLVSPKGALYQNLEKDETVILVVGRHWIGQLFPAVLGGLFFIVPLLGLIIALMWLKNDMLLKYLIMIGWFWFSFVFFYFLALFLRWKTDIYIITNERIINLDANALNFKSSTDLDLSHITSVQHTSSGGIIRGGIDYGEVIVHLISDEEPIVMKNIPMPAHVALVIGELAEQVGHSETQPPEVRVTAAPA